MAQEDQRKNDLSAGVPAREESDAVTTSDGAVRQMEKADLVATQPADVVEGGQRPDPAQDPDWGEVVPLGKEGNGAPEEDAADAGRAGGGR